MIATVALVGGYLLWKSRATPTTAPETRSSTSDTLRSAEAALFGTGLDTSRADVLRPTDVLSGTRTTGADGSPGAAGPTASDSQTAFVTGQVEAF